jgi:hypothetical protein
MVSVWVEDKIMRFAKTHTDIDEARAAAARLAGERGGCSSYVKEKEP